MSDHIITEQTVLEACQLLYARRGRRPSTLVLHPADWVGLRSRLEKGSGVVSLTADRILLGPFELAVATDAQCERNHFGLLYGPRGGPRDGATKTD
ncbi:MAG TPA: hypothetical protein VN848_10300 [Gemmatimonadales bacterium]|nr:hypothetical protein [Gemmatimonadales bacterium]